MKFRLATFLVPTLFAAFTTLHAQTPVAPAYTVTDLGTLPGFSISYGYALNNAGDVAGQLSGAVSGIPHAALFKNGTVTDLGLLPGDFSSQANGINDAGVVVGQSGTARAWTYSGGTITQIPGSSGTSFARGINNAGTVTGQNGNNGFTYSPAGGFSILPGMGAGEAGSTSAINNVGQAAGFIRGASAADRAVIFAGGTATTVGGTLPGEYGSYARAINDAGVVVGLSRSTTTGDNAFVAQGGVRTDLGILPGGTRSDASGINNHGQIVGFADTATTNFDGFLVSGGTMSQLSSLLPVATGANSIVGYAINDWGQIAAYGKLSTTGGWNHALLMSPVNALTFLSNGNRTRDTRFVGGMAYNTFTPTTNPSNLGTTVNLLGGTTGSNGRQTFGLNRDVVATLSAGDPTKIASDLVTLTGTEGDKFVISLTYDEALATSLFGDEMNAALGSFSGGLWNLAVTGNSSGTAHKIFGAYNPTTDFVLGEYGVDTATNTVWAVVDHTGQFGAVPEPGTYTLLAFGLLGLALVRLRRSSEAVG